MTSSPDPAPRSPRRDDPRMQTVEMAALHLEDVTASDLLGSGPVRPVVPTLRTALLVAAGGAVGAMLRYALSLLAPAVATPTLVEIPWATLTVNVLGCLGLGALGGVLEVRPGRPWMQPLLGTGLCGGFTTMSTVVLEGSAMIGADFPIIALSYALMTIVLCLVAVVVGMLGARWIARRMSARRDGGSRNALPATGDDS